MKCVIFVFVDSFLTSSHVQTLCKSLLYDMINLSYSFHSRSNVVSCAKSIENRIWEDFKKSFTKQIKSRVPRIEPWGTQMLICGVLEE